MQQRTKVIFVLFIDMCMLPPIKKNEIRLVKLYLHLFKIQLDAFDTAEHIPFKRSGFHLLKIKAYVFLSTYINVQVNSRAAGRTAKTNKNTHNLVCLYQLVNSI